EIAEDAGSDVLQDLEHTVAAVAQEERYGPHDDAGDRPAEAGSRLQRRDDVERREQHGLVTGSERGRRQGLGRPDPPPGERGTGVEGGVPRAAGGALGVLEESLGAADLPLDPIDDRADVSSRDPAKARDVALRRSGVAATAATATATASATSTSTAPAAEQ